MNMQTDNNALLEDAALDDEALGSIEAVADEDIEVVLDDGMPEVEAETEAEAAPAEAEDSGEPATEPYAGVPDEELEDGDATYPEPIKKRIKREIRKRKAVEQETQQVRQAALQVAQLAKQKDEEITQVRKQFVQLQRAHAETLDYSYQQAIQIKQTELRRAREDGNYDTEQTIQGEIDSLRYTHNQIKDSLRVLPTVDAVQSAPAPQSRPQPQTQPGAPAQMQAAPPAPQAVKWVERNKTWFGSPKFAGHRAFVLAEDARLAAEGYDKHSDEYYKELDRRIDEAFPTLRKRPGRDAPNTLPPVAGATTGRSAAPANGRRSIRLTSTDLDNMRRFGLDPANKEHLREYAKNKQAAA